MTVEDAHLFAPVPTCSALALVDKAPDLHDIRYSGQMREFSVGDHLDLEFDAERFAKAPAQCRFEAGAFGACAGGFDEDRHLVASRGRRRLDDADILTVRFGLFRDQG